MEEIQTKYWMVHGVHRSPPSRMHVTETSAETEAKRLAEQNPGIRFTVLESVSCFMAPAPIASRVKIEDQESPEDRRIRMLTTLSSPVLYGEKQ